MLFDKKVLCRHLQKYKLPNPFEIENTEIFTIDNPLTYQRYFDTLSFISMYGAIASKGYGIGALRRVAKILQIKTQNKHSALEDCRTLASILRHIHQHEMKNTPQVLCPICKGPTELKTNRKTANRFWGCIAWPKCKGTVNHK